MSVEGLMEFAVEAENEEEAKEMAMNACSEKVSELDDIDIVVTDVECQ